MRVLVLGACELRRTRTDISGNAQVLGAEASQAAVYRASAQGIADQLFKGRNACWLAMGPPQVQQRQSTDQACSGGTMGARPPLSRAAMCNHVPRLPTPCACVCASKRVLNLHTRSLPWCGLHSAGAC